jgi:hypothetical protein
MLKNRVVYFFGKKCDLVAVILTVYLEYCLQFGCSLVYEAFMCSILCLEKYPEKEEEMH